MVSFWLLFFFFDTSNAKPPYNYKTIRGYDDDDDDCFDDDDDDYEIENDNDDIITINKEMIGFFGVLIVMVAFIVPLLGVLCFRRFCHSSCLSPSDSTRNINHSEDNDTVATIDDQEDNCNDDNDDDNGDDATGNVRVIISLDERKKRDNNV